jgi:CRP/FNR family cyclic AMP-dependent transcriptional regulator
MRDGERLNQLGKGDFFGEIALVSDSPRTATVTATSPVRALVITDRAFRQLLDEQPEIQRKVLVALAERLAPHHL